MFHTEDPSFVDCVYNLKHPSTLLSALEYFLFLEKYYTIS